MKVNYDKPFYLIAEYWLGDLKGFIKIGDDREEIEDYFNQSNENAFKKMIREYKKLQSLTRSKALKRVSELKKEIIDLKSDIKISK